MPPKPHMQPQMHVYPPPLAMPQPDQRSLTLTQPTVLQPADNLLETADEVLDLAGQVLDLQDRRSPTWAALERGGTPTSPYSDGAVDEVGI